MFIDTVFHVFVPELLMFNIIIEYMHFPTISGKNDENEFTKSCLHNRNLP